MQLREDVEVILQYGIHPTQSFGKILLLLQRIPTFALQYFSRGNRLLRDYNQLEERHHRINMWKYEPTETSYRKREVTVVR
jgi:hypothetical protein